MQLRLSISLHVIQAPKSQTTIEEPFINLYFFTCSLSNYMLQAYKTMIKVRLTLNHAVKQ